MIINPQTPLILLLLLFACQVFAEDDQLTDPIFTEPSLEPITVKTGLKDGVSIILNNDSRLRSDGMAITAIAKDYERTKIELLNELGEDSSKDPGRYCKAARLAIILNVTDAIPLLVNNMGLRWRCTIHTTQRGEPPYEILKIIWDFNLKTISDEIIKAFSQERSDDWWEAAGIYFYRTPESRSIAKVEIEKILLMDTTSSALKVRLTSLLNLVEKVP